MSKCSRCGYQLDDVDLKRNKCPVCEKPINPRRKGEDPRAKLRDEDRMKRPL